MSEDKIIYPFGWLAGKPGQPEDVIQALAIEMLGHRADLREKAARAKDPADREEYTRRADDIERYAVMVYAVYYQMQPERWNAEACGGLLEVAAEHGITLPHWMTGQ